MGQGVAVRPAETGSDDFYDLMETFFGFVCGESFEDGLAWADQTARARGPVPAEAMAAYFRARVTLESSYRYRSAARDIEAAATGFEAAAEAGASALFVGAIADLTRMQSALMTVDRGVYCERPPLLAEGSALLTALAGRIADVGERLWGREKTLFDRYVAGEAAAHGAYGRGIAMAAAAYAPYADAAPDAAATLGAAAELEAVGAALRASGSSILAEDLAPHAKTLRALADIAPTFRSRLEVVDGEATLRRMALLDVAARDALLAALERGAGPLAAPLAGVGGEPPRADPTPDIWAQIFASDQIRSYSWTPPPVTLHFRGRALTCDLRIRYVSLGLFSVELATPLEGADAFAVRHLHNLATPFALDERFEATFDGETTTYGFFGDLARAALDRLSAALTPHLPKADRNAPLIYAADLGSAFVTTRINCVQAVGPDGRGRLLSGGELRAHPEARALLSPSREVRTSLFHWTRYPPTETLRNLAAIRYCPEDYILVRREEAIQATLDQPRWVSDQAEQSVAMASAIVSLLRLTNAQFAKDDAMDGLARSEAIARIEGLPVSALRRLQAQIGVNLHRAERAQGDLTRLIGLIETGQLSTFADHTEFMRAILAEMDFPAAQERAKELLRQTAASDAELLKQAEIVHERLRTRLSAAASRVFSGALLVLSAATLVEVFPVWNESGLGPEIGPAGQIGVLSVLFALGLGAIIAGRASGQ